MSLGIEPPASAATPGVAGTVQPTQGSPSPGTAGTAVPPVNPAAAVDPGAAQGAVNPAAATAPGSVSPSSPTPVKVVPDPVRWDSVQTLTDAQKAQARSNMGAVSQPELNVTLGEVEAARDAAVAGAEGVYADTAEGLAATTNGQYFTVPSGDANHSLDLYKNDTGTAVLEKSYPTAEMVNNMSVALSAASSDVGFFLGNAAADQAVLEEGYVKNVDGSEGVSSGWRRTGFIEVHAASVVNCSASIVGSGGGCNLAFYDEDQVYLGYHNMLVSGEDVLVSETFPTAKYVRGAEPSTGGFEFYVTNKIKNTSVEMAISSFAPVEAYALKNEPFYMHARGIVADRSFALAWDISASNDRVAKLTPTTTADIPVTLRATRSDGVHEDVADFKIKVADTPVNPAAARNVICMGDSLTEGISNAGIQGAYVNELSRRLNGIGTELLSGAQSPAALALSNVIFRGSRGDQAIKHEGRGGWNADNYLTDDEVAGVTNSFWNAAANGGAGGFDFNYYLAQNSFDLTGDPTNGVDATGSNLTVIILLGWNDAYGIGASASAADLGTLIDAIKTARADVDVLLVGLNPAPAVNFKNFSGTRYVSEQDVFNTVVRDFGTEWLALAEVKANTEFLQLSHVFDAETGYSTTNSAVSARSADTLLGSSDHVHPNVVGYCYIADALFYKLIHKYCQ